MKIFSDLKIVLALAGALAVGWGAKASFNSIMKNNNYVTSTQVVDIVREEMGILDRLTQIEETLSYITDTINQDRLIAIEEKYEKIRQLLEGDASTNVRQAKTQKIIGYCQNGLGALHDAECDYIVKFHLTGTFTEEK